MKKTVFFIIIFLTLVSCAKKKYEAFSVNPVPPALTVSAGQESFITLKVELPGSDHIYGNPKGPGIGKPTEVTVESSDALRFSTARYLPAEKFQSPGDKNFVWIYRGDTYIFLPFSVRKTEKTGGQKVKIRFSSLLCSETTCIPKEAEWEYPVKIGSAAGITPVSPGILKLFQASKVPESSGFSDTGGLPRTANNIKSRYFSGLSFQPQYYEQRISGLIQAILFGILAGFFLNFMPCVLPVVSLKVMSFVQNAANDRKTLLKLGIIFSSGILTSFLVLAGLAAFLGHGWGDLFQQQWFILVMIAVVFTLALSLFGVFQLNMPSFAGRAASGRGGTYTDAYIKGLLATLLATPCSGPFLGGTLAWALTQSPAVIFAIFMSVGAGMAFPYFVLTLNPAFLRFVPKPGGWMVYFERIMGFLLIFTVIYLLGILENGSLMPALVFLGFLAAGLWQYGSFGSLVQPRGKRIASVAVLAALCVSGYFLSFEYLFKKPAGKMVSADFSAERVLANRDAGKTTMIKFTADWCPNCRLVEKTALNTEKVAASIKAHDIDFLTADITRPNPPAQELMALAGNKSIPFLAILPPGEKFLKPVCLRDLYTESDVLRAINDAVKK